MNIKITKDGVTVAEAVEIEGHFENLGATVVKSVASKTGDDAGDGTSTSIVLAQAIIDKGLKSVSAGASPTDIKIGIDKAVKAVVGSIKSQSNEIGRDYTKIKEVAKVSANNDDEVATLIADAMDRVTEDGVINYRCF